MTNNDNNNDYSLQENWPPQKKQLNTKVMMIPIVIDAFGSHKKIGAGTGELWYKKTSRDHPNYSIIKNN